MYWIRSHLLWKGQRITWILYWEWLFMWASVYLSHLFVHFKMKNKPRLAWNFPSSVICVTTVIQLHLGFFHESLQSAMKCFTILMYCAKLPSSPSWLHRLRGRQQMAETNCDRADTSLMMAGIIEEHEHTTPRGLTSGWMRFCAFLTTEV